MKNFGDVDESEDGEVLDNTSKEKTIFLRIHLIQLLSVGLFPILNTWINFSFVWFVNGIGYGMYSFILRVALPSHRAGSAGLKAVLLATKPLIILSLVYSAVSEGPTAVFSLLTGLFFSIIALIAVLARARV